MQSRHVEHQKGPPSSASVKQIEFPPAEKQDYEEETEEEEEEEEYPSESPILPSQKVVRKRRRKVNKISVNLTCFVTYFM